MKMIINSLQNALNKVTARIDLVVVNVLTLSVVFFIFGLLKVLNISPVYDFVAATTPPFSNVFLFRLLGVFEVVLAIGLLIKPIRVLSALVVIAHLLGTITVSLISYKLITDPTTILNLHGEFVMKNFVLIASAINIIKLQLGSNR